MSSEVANILNILHEAEALRVEGFRKIAGCLPTTLDPVLSSIFQNECRIGRQTSDGLIAEVSQIVQVHKVRLRITDWPFENFWENPHEPKHSKLLAYFIDPKAEHGCGDFLLKRFLATLEESISIRPGFFQPTGCEIHCESGHIDLSILQQSANVKKYAIIIENKVNGAQNQDNQLRRYVEKIKRDGFSSKQIFVFYLPLTLGQEPNSDDKKWLKENEVKFEPITFEKDIYKWLESSLTEWPAKELEMREHVSYYRNLIVYLNEKQKQRKMNIEILRQLEKFGKNALPTLSQIENLQKATEDLKGCLQMALRGRLILETQRYLLEKGFTAWLCEESVLEGKIEDASEYDVRFQKSIDLCIPINDAVKICLGGNDEGFWFGYMRDGSEKDQKKIQKCVLDEAARQSNKFEEEENWFAYWWHWHKDPTMYNNFETKENLTSTAKSYGEKMIEMRNNLVGRLGKGSTKN
jgi:PD-(D/E)XK nuclease superfamily